MNKKNELAELKLRCKGRNQLEQWLAKFSTVIQPTPFPFVYNTDKYDDASVLFPIKDTQQFYLKTSNLEYILCKWDMVRFFKVLQELQELQENKGNRSSHIKENEERDEDGKSELNEKDIDIRVN